MRTGIAFKELCGNIAGIVQTMGEQRQTHHLLSISGPSGQSESPIAEGRSILASQVNIQGNDVARAQILNEQNPVRKVPSRRRGVRQDFEFYLVPVALHYSLHEVMTWPVPEPMLLN